MNKYEVLGIVGEGAYGVVLKCRNRATNAVCAVKKFKESEEDDLVRKTTLREVKILRLLEQQNIVLLHEAFRRKGKLYLVFEYVPRNLLEILEENSKGLDRAAESVRRYIYQLCMAIHWCHSHSVVHRDIKPENLLVDPQKRTLKLCDFGFARTISVANHEALTDYVATRWYRAPELLLSTTDYTFAVDIWAIGCIMGELTDGQPLFPGENEIDQLYVIQEIIGPMTSDQMQKFMRNPRFRGLRFPDMLHRHDTLQKKYGKYLPKEALDFMRKCLYMDPKRRITAKEAINHPWFEGLGEEYGATASQMPVREEDRVGRKSPTSIEQGRKSQGSKGSKIRSKVSTKSGDGSTFARKASPLSTETRERQSKRIQSPISKPKAEHRSKLKAEEIGEDCDFESVESKYDEDSETESVEESKRAQSPTKYEESVAQLSISDEEEEKSAFNQSIADKYPLQEFINEASNTRRNLGEKNTEKPKKIYSFKSNVAQKSQPTHQESGPLTPGSNFNEECVPSFSDYTFKEPLNAAASDKPRHLDTEHDWKIETTGNVNKKLSKKPAKFSEKHAVSRGGLRKQKRAGTSQGYRGTENTLRVINTPAESGDTASLNKFANRKKNAGGTKDKVDDDHHSRRPITRAEFLCRENGKQASHQVKNIQGGLFLDGTGKITDSSHTNGFKGGKDEDEGHSQSKTPTYKHPESQRPYEINGQTATVKPNPVVRESAVNAAKTTVKPKKEGKPRVVARINAGENRATKPNRHHRTQGSGFTTGQSVRGREIRMRR